EHGRVGADAQREAQDDDERDEGRRAHCADGSSEITHGILPTSISPERYCESAARPLNRFSICAWNRCRAAHLLQCHAVTFITRSGRAPSPATHCHTVAQTKSRGSSRDACL